MNKSIYCFTKNMNIGEKQMGVIKSYGEGVQK